MPGRASFGMQHPMLPRAWGEQPHIKSRRISLLYALCWRRGAWEWVLNMGEVGAEDGRLRERMWAKLFSGCGGGWGLRTRKEEFGVADNNRG